MKQVSLLVLVASGTLCGVVSVFGQSQTTHDRPPALLQWPSEQPSGVAETENFQPPLPKAAVHGATFDFGFVIKNSRQSHEFTLRNEGNSPLTLSVGPSTCQCTVAELRHRSIMPGRSTKIKVDWNAHQYEGPFEEIATIKTNDPRQQSIELTIKGIAVAPLALVPDELVLGRVLAGQPVSSKVKLLSHTDDKVKILGIECLEPETADFFQIDYTPLSDEEIGRQEHVKQGFEITVTVKPGLPQGPFLQTIRFQTTSLQAESLTLDVRGRIGSNILIAGPGWYKQRDLLYVGMVDSRRGAKRTLRLVARGPHCRDIKFKVVETWPSDLLHATLGKTAEINNGKATQTPLKIEIPKGSRPANHLSLPQTRPGRIVLKSNCTNVPKIIVPVYFAVKDG